ncbi:hypothetical protein K437DRAFT_284167 [Tilletiaria anomala UBC 951]|uniref:O-acyltransferase n=1 Tax=Tilletiaria anomala (strain ATCC 24038 / CBS 436.72 / UBC 951) TaxID=1037660 RepID=A0A066WAW1_TILAU|nr:uncharacterized protein K437DRAFT_284167 [Tilletiaria anomala UBC 951]KDN48229.1 hypothetical protein K437DRAFT_284167 [Tilletiaria anomala UBC 951]
MARARSDPPDSESDGVIAHSSVTTRITDRQGRTLTFEDPQHDGQLQGSDTTNDGGIYLRPLPASARKGLKIRTLVTFQPRQSRFDRFNMDSSKDGFRGFYTLFWIGIFLLMLNTFYTSYKETGQVLSLTFATLFSRDAKILAISDGILVGHLFLCVPFIGITQRGWIPYSTGLIYLQHLWQAVMLAAVIKWTHFRSWPWVQSGFFVLHTLAMMMKMHSYISVNGNMADTFWQMKRKEKLLRTRVLEVEGVEVEGVEVDVKAEEQDATSANAQDERLQRAWRKACEEALGSEDIDTHWCSLELQQGTSPLRYRSQSSAATKEMRGISSATVLSSKATTEESSAAEDDDPRISASTSPATSSTATPNGSANGYGNGHSDYSSGAIGSKYKEKKDNFMIRDPHPLATHPDASIAKLASDIEIMREELLSHIDHHHIDNGDSPSSSAPGRVAWPANVTYRNFWEYLLIPSLVYDLEFPRTKSIRPLYVLEKVSATFGTFFVIYVITEHWIMPFQPGPNETLIGTFLQLAVPMMINYLLIFYIMFECICNAFAELTRFADREFYSDWWNATSMDAFSRKWNKPVHNFLLRHVYASSIAVGASKASAMFVTFLLSSLLHELVMAIVSGKIRGYLFLMQMAQLPLIALGQVPFIKQNETLGNLIFWVGLMMGFPLLNILYISY